MISGFMTIPAGTNTTTSKDLSDKEKPGIKSLTYENTPYVHDEDFEDSHEIVSPQDANNVSDIDSRSNNDEVVVDR